MSRREKKRIQNEMKNLQKMNEKELQTYVRLTDPNNVFIRELTLGGSEGLKKL